MNDPGLDDAIADEANALDLRPSSRDKGSTTSGKNTASPSLDSQQSLKARWWLASTAYPLTAGTFGPMASAFNVCCLAQTWRMVPDSGGGYLNIPDPKWFVNSFYMRWKYPNFLQGCGSQCDFVGMCLGCQCGIISQHG